MKSIPTILSLSVCLLTSSLSASSATSLVAHTEGTATEIDRNGQVLRTLSSNAEIEEGHAIVTQPGGRVSLLLPNGAVVSVHGDTRLVMRTVQVDGPLHYASAGPLQPSAAPTRIDLLLQKGGISGDAGRLGPRASFKISTRIGQAEVLHDQFEVRIDKPNCEREWMIATNINGELNLRKKDGAQKSEVLVERTGIIEAETECNSGAILAINAEVQSTTAEISAMKVAIAMAVQTTQTVERPTPIFYIPLGAFDMESALDSSDIPVVIGTPL